MPSLDTLYPAIAFPPVLDGAAQLITTCPFPGVAPMLCGALGTVLGIDDILTVIPSPTALNARTLSTYVVPLVNPVNVWLLTELPSVVHVLPPSLDTLYPVIALPPLLDGADQLIVNCPFAGVVVTLCGALGVVGVVVVLLTIVPLPAELTARTLSVYAVPFANPVNV